MWQRKHQGTYESQSGAIGGKREECEHPSQKIFTNGKINFKTLPSTRTEMNIKMEYIHGLAPTYLAGLQETRGDIEKIAQNFDQEIQKQKKKDHDAR